MVFCTGYASFCKYANYRQSIRHMHKEWVVVGILKLFQAIFKTLGGWPETFGFLSLVRFLFCVTNIHRLNLSGHPVNSKFIYYSLAKSVPPFIFSVRSGLLQLANTFCLYLIPFFFSFVSFHFATLFLLNKNKSLTGKLKSQVCQRIKSECWL